MQPFRVRVDLGTMAKNGYSAFPKDQALLEPHYQIVLSFPGHLLAGAGCTLQQKSSRCIYILRRSLLGVFESKQSNVPVYQAFVIFSQHGLVSLFNDISLFMEYSVTKISLEENSSGCI